MCLPRTRCTFFPRHALHKNVYRAKTSDGPLVSSQEQRALLVLVVNRLSTGYQQVVNRSLCSFIGLHRTPLVRASGRTFRRCYCVFDALGVRGTLVSRVNCSVAARSAWRHPAAPLCAPTRLACSMSGFWIRQVLTCRIQNPYIPRAGRFGAARGGAAGQSRAGYSRTPTGRSGQE